MATSSTAGAAAARINREWALNGRAYLAAWHRGEDCPGDLPQLYRRFFALWAAQENNMPDTTSQGERIAFRSTRGHGVFAKARWSELAVYFNPQAEGGNVFTAESVGRSSYDGEHDRATRLSSASLERALQHFMTSRTLSAPAQSVIDQARLWAMQQQGLPGSFIVASGTVSDAPQMRGYAAPAGPTYSDEQRDAAVAVVFDRADVGYTREHAVKLVDQVATALGLTRESARG